SIRTPQGSESPEDMPWCKRIAAVYCSPEVKNSAGGDQLCAQGAANFYTRYLSRPPADRAAQDKVCASVHPGVGSAMRQHARAVGPGPPATAGSAAAWGALGAPPSPPPAPAPAPPAPPVPGRTPPPTAPGVATAP